MISLESFHCHHDGPPTFTMKVESLCIEYGKRVLIIGPSGSGKSPLLKGMAGLLPQCRPRLSIDGKAIYSGSRLRGRGVMYLSQELGLWPHLNCLQHLSFVLSDGKRLHHDQAVHWLDTVNLAPLATSRPHQLSGGEQKRLALARAMAAQPRYLLLDEPFANIDLVQAEELMIMIDREQHRRNFSLIKVTHHSLGSTNSDTRFLVLDKGRIIQDGYLDDLRSRPANEWTRKWVTMAL